MASNACRVIQAVVLAGIDAAPARLVAVPFGPAVEREGLAFNADHLLDRQAIFLRKFEIALVVRRHRHHRAFAVAHQHVVADPHRHRFAGERMGDDQAGGHAFLFHRRHVGFGHAAVLAFIDEGGEFWIVLRGLGGQRMLGGDGDEGHAHEGVGTGGEDPQQRLSPLCQCGVVGELNASRTPTLLPIQLRCMVLTCSGQPGKLSRPVSSSSAYCGDAEEIHRDFALFDQRAGAPAAAVDHLLVGQHGLVDRVPVHRGDFLVDHALFEQAGEQPLLPAVVVRLAGGQFARPVDGQAQACSWVRM